MRRVYLAGPYGSGDAVEPNVRAAIAAAHLVRELGAAPFVPHLCVLWHEHHPRSSGDWTEYDREWLLACDVLLRIPGESPGADQEVALAKSLSMPVFESVSDLAAWMRAQEQRPAGALG